MTPHVLIATAELSPLVKVGGLADAVAGLRAALLDDGVEVTTALPDHQGWALAREVVEDLPVPAWAAPARARTGRLPDGSPITLVEVPGMRRDHPYLDEHGDGWPDNAQRFLAWAAAVAAITDQVRPDVLHLHDWHAGPVLGFLADPPPTVFTIHNLLYQGRTSGSWLTRLTHHRQAYEWYGDLNPMSGAIALADRVVTVSPTYADEILQPAFGVGLDGPLAMRADHLSGIRNGIDTTTWDPATDPHLAVHFDADDVGPKRELRRWLQAEAGWSGPDAVVGMVTRLTEQKGVDLALELVPYLAGIGARLVVLGSGNRALAEGLREAAAAHPDRLWFHQGYDEGLAHHIFAGADLLLMPSRFEPCGLNQMQAMRYGTLPVATPVGGLLDTVVDGDADPAAGTGFLSADVSVAGLVDALHRAVRALRSPTRRATLMRNGMTTDWSWDAPAAEYRSLYEEVLSTEY